MCQCKPDSNYSEEGDWTESIVYSTRKVTRSCSFTKPGFKNQTAPGQTITNSNSSISFRISPALKFNNISALMLSGEWQADVHKKELNTKTTQISGGILTYDMMLVLPRLRNLNKNLLPELISSSFSSRDGARILD